MLSDGAAWFPGMNGEGSSEGDEEQQTEGQYSPEPATQYDIVSLAYIVKALSQCSPFISN